MNCCFSTGCMIFVASGSCLSKEYSTRAGRCCPMCKIGTVVQMDCTSHTGTLCRGCENGTFMNQSNRLDKCFTCTSCDSGPGLFVLQGCSETTDTVCEVIDGYYCKDLDVTGCSAAQKHTQCVPGEKIQEPGTSREDVQCEPCQSGFFSEHGVNCTDWTTCPGTQVKVKEGRRSSDVVCGGSSRSHYIVMLPTLLLDLTVVALFIRAVSLARDSGCTSRSDGSLKSNG
ncbi:tumor necrosis factor receptor superfamily member 5-like [Notothenia coriiceps]|uniref:Tumor necrosis factor receptor superfamily member 5-like n=1 Tax=Notothenia coriiceps TaxID=8208 RepID=A0A6I9NI96_9TELE|nr:PREDICTED: tumor necrosis factor receptor superfamily member 5-like [Notothenia coriiceps]XP_010774838.1 PREDICTED: tumor necrosis factor receptor superfamily member 5-like [Notothenia coriiceps]